MGAEMNERPSCCRAYGSEHHVNSCYCAQNYHPLPVVLEKGEGVYLTDTNGKRYIDCMSAYSAVNFGHCHPAILDAAENQMKKLCITSRAFSNTKLCLFMERLCKLTSFEVGLAMNSGAEAVETAIKVARKWAYRKKGVPHDQAEIIVTSNNFHGRTTTLVSFSSCEQYRAEFGPLTPGFKMIPYNDPQSLEAAITEKTAAFLVEPIQGEGGVIIPDAGYLKRCHEICHHHGVLLLCDEIQTGLGRTGKMLASHHDGIQPDGIMLGKSLGGGVYPVSAFLTKEAIMEVIEPGDHGSTFGGNPLASAIGLASLSLIEELSLAKRAQKFGDYFLSQLKTIHSPVIQEIRGRGLMIGLEVDSQRLSARKLALLLMEKGILTKDTHDTVLRLAPPLIIEKEQIDTIVAAIRDCVS
jgi:ornithine--oxo-acid transaminase